MIRVLLHGCSGKMGRMVTQSACQFEDITIVAGVDRAVSDPPLPYPVYTQLDEVAEESDVIIDFSRPEGLPALLEFAQARRLPVVLATTGLTEEEMALVQNACSRIALFQAANMSVGIKVMQRLLTQATRFLGGEADIEIVETHHNQKVDAPSGTALALADTINDVFGQEKQYVFGRHGRGEKRSPVEIGIHALRGGTVAGDHEVFFLGQDEVLSIKHHAASRQVFAIGALKAARFLVGQAPGHYDMDDLVSDAVPELTFAVRIGLTLVTLPTDFGPMLSIQIHQSNITPLYSALAPNGAITVVDSSDLSTLLQLTSALHVTPYCAPVCQLTISGAHLPGDLTARALTALAGPLAPLALLRSEGHLVLWMPSALREQAEEALKSLLEN